MKLKKITFSQNSITVWTVDRATDREFKEKTHESPLPTLLPAFANLVAVVQEIMEVHRKWIEGIIILGLAVSYTKEGTRTATITFRRKFLKNTKFFTLSTPAFQFDPPAEGEEDDMECTIMSATLLTAAINEAEAYAQGKRLQTEFEFDDAEPDPDGPSAKPDTPGQQKMAWEICEEIDFCKSKKKVLEVCKEYGVDMESYMKLKLDALKEEAKSQIEAHG
jgi:hypothetical protein